MAWSDQHPAPTNEIADGLDALWFAVGAWLAAIVIAVPVVWLATRGW